MAVPTIRVTWALPPELYESLKAEAGRKGMSMQALHNAGMNLKGKVLLWKAIRSLEIDTEEAA